MENSTLNYNWYAVRVKSRSEKKVNSDLAEQNIESYLPLQKKLRQWSDRKKWVEMPLISGYVFVYISRKEYEVVLKTYNVVSYVFFEGKAAIIRDADIELLKRMLGQVEVELEITVEHLKPGQMVEIISGPLCGVIGELIDFKGKNKVALRIPPLGYTVLVEAPGKNLTPYNS
ncbi:MAG TPA: UpxY family transcription antiterminator [Prolixibacteraceae bacterium]|nr:UpxY family transcription antiterminator [Prolixibacteraceae bacterium]